MKGHLGWVLIGKDDIIARILTEWVGVEKYNNVNIELDMGYDGLFEVCLQLLNNANDIV